MVVIPTRNEDQSAVDAMVEASPKVTTIVVDDSEPPLRDVAHVLRGTGSLAGAILEGFRFAKEYHFSRCVIIDAGGSHDLADIPRMEAVDADVVIGSRFAPGGTHNGSWWRSVGSRVAARAFNLRYRTHIHDWTSGYRVYSDKAVAAILEAGPQCKRHAIQAEILAICIDAGLTVREVPITYTVGSGSTFSRKAVAEIIHLWLTSWR